MAVALPSVILAEIRRLLHTNVEKARRQYSGCLSELWPDLSSLVSGCPFAERALRFGLSGVFWHSPSHIHQGKSPAEGRSGLLRYPWAAGGMWVGSSQKMIGQRGRSRVESEF